MGINWNKVPSPLAKNAFLVAGRRRLGMVSVLELWHAKRVVWANTIRCPERLRLLHASIAWQACTTMFLGKMPPPIAKVVGLAHTVLHQVPLQSVRVKIVVLASIPRPSGLEKKASASIAPWVDTVAPRG